MCPNCRNFTNAPAGQKSRRCSYCGKIINITKAACAVFDSSEKAIVAVKEFNASRGGEEFNEALKRSRKRIKELVPNDTLVAEDLASVMSTVPSGGKMRRLMSLLENEASTKPCTLGRFEDLCNSLSLDWAWVESQLMKLSNEGSLIFPRPWTIQLVTNQKSDADIVE